MIGKTNIPTGMSKGETVSILLKTNQSSNEDLNGVKVVVSYDDESHEYSYNGQFSVEIPKDKTYTVTFGEVDGYKTPSSVTYTAVKGFSRSIEVTYYGEKVTVNVSAEGGASVDGNTASVHTSINGLGVYIQDINGRLWDESEWDNSTTPNGIAVITHECQFVIALEDVESGYWLEESVILDGLPSLDETSAQQDYNGINNTAVLLSSELSSPAAINCNNYTFPDGSKGYLGAAGEWQAVIDNEAKITSALNLCGGSFTIKGNGVYYWTSTQYNIGSAYIAASEYLGSTLLRVATQGKKSDVPVRAFTSIGSIEEYPITNGEASFSVPYDETYTVSLSDMDGYTTPESQTYTASQPTREISMEYKKAVEHVIVNVSSDDNIDMDGYKVYVRPNVANGVYIQDVDGNLYTESEWNTMKVANGIAVVTDECSFVLALEDVGDKPQWSSSSSMASLTHTDSEEEAVLDYNGLGNTVEMLNTGVSDENNAVRYCADYRFLNGQLGYLGAAGEWDTVARFISEINELLSVVGGASIASIEYWTSTAFYTSVRAWTINPVSGALYYRQLSTNNAARAFTKLGSSYTITNGKVEFDIPIGVEYTISVEDVDGYTTPEPQSFVAESGTRTVNMVYKEVKLGVFIQGVSGKLYETAAWTKQETPNGVAVITEECSFVIALTESYEMRIHSSASGVLENYMTAIPNETQAKADYDGAANTANIIKLQNGINYAAGWCDDFSFPSGKWGFLPSLGQMWAAYSNKSAVDAALNKVGGRKLLSDYYWTSTFRGMNNNNRYRLCWILDWSDGAVSSDNLYAYFRVRAFSDL